ncbi:MAG: hypothetical protein FXF47_01820 [Candidatus Mcinerneyibacterium aminivorans]|uniref:Uncharacterized protein n=1 Tax=Candidatus Mcinerneyibacterium aminivorans TaxID=2703815 RepID=A0A5D0MMR9_9BACT|nr:MAG: hypothetical protein FXF47_01820 [Candidatus Mcinerneyibacterium aminivorans]
MRKFFIILLLVIFILSNTWAVSKVDFLSLNTKEDVSEKYMEKSDKTYTLVFTEKRAVYIGTISSSTSENIKFTSFLGEEINIKKDHVKDINKSVKEADISKKIKSGYEELYDMKLPVLLFNDNLDLLVTKSNKVYMGSLNDENNNKHNLNGFYGNSYEFDKHNIKKIYSVEGINKFLLLSKLSYTGDIDDILNHSKKDDGITPFWLIPLYVSIGLSAAFLGCAYLVGGIAGAVILYGVITYGPVLFLVSLVFTSILRLLAKDTIEMKRKRHKDFLNFLKTGKLTELKPNISLNLDLNYKIRNELSIGFGVNF